MKYQLEIYVEGTRLDLFDAQSVTLKKSVKNFRDISKVFTSFSRNIEVPASKTNNKVFKHYSNLRIIEGGFDARTLKTAELKLNGKLLEQGTIALEKVNKQFGEVVSYGIRFYGGLAELKKKIGEDYLHNLDLSDSNIDNPNYQTLLSTLPAYQDVIYMLSSINRRFIYHSSEYDYAQTQGLEKIVNIAYDNTIVGGQPTNDPDYYGVVDSDLVGAVSCAALLFAIERKYNIVFEGAIYADYIANYRLLLNSASRENNLTTMNEYEVTNLGSANSTIDIEAPYFDGVVNAEGDPVNYGSSAFPIAVYNDSTNSFRVNEVFEDKRFFRMEGVGLSTFSSTGFIVTDRFVGLKQYQLRVCVQTTVTNFEVDVLRDGEVVETITESNPQESTTFRFNRGTDTRIDADDEKAGEADWSFKVRAQGNGTINIHYRIAQNFTTDVFFGDNDFNHMGTKVTPYTTKSISVTSAGSDYVDIAAGLPKMKIKDFLSVLMKQFNLIPTVSIDEYNSTIVDFKHYDYYINQGNLYDINDYVDISREEVTPANFYSGIEFKHEDPKSGMEQAFFKVNNRSYGSLDYTFEENNMQIQGSMFEVDINTHRIPIESLLDLNTASSARKNWLQLTDINNNTTDLGATFLYVQRDAGTIAYNTGTTVTQLSDVNVPSNMYYITGVLSDTGGYCGNFWGSEVDEYHLDARFADLGNLNCFWDSYLSLMFDAQTRKVKLSAFLPEGIMMSLNTNDRLKINERFFIIESFKTNFATGKTDFELIEVTPELLELFEANQLTINSDLISDYSSSDLITKTSQVWLDSSDGQLKWGYANLSINAVGSPKNITLL